MRFQDANFQPFGMFFPASLQNILSTAALLLTLGLTNMVFAQTAIGGIAPHTSAMLDIQSAERGVLFPRMTTDERDDIEMPATSLIIFNTATVCLEINLGTPQAPSWQSITCAEMVEFFRTQNSLKFVFIWERKNQIKAARFGAGSMKNSSYQR